jgi:hypothetical protein
MIKKSFISIACIYALLMGTAFAEDNACQNKTNDYCISVDVKNSKKPDNVNQDLCFVMQVNASDKWINGSIPMQQLPAIVFSMQKNHMSLGKPLAFKIIKAQVVPSGQCATNRPHFVAVEGCELLEYATLAGVSRSILLTKHKRDVVFTCDIVP